MEGQSSTVTAAHASTAATVATLQTAVTTLQSSSANTDAVDGAAGLTVVGAITEVIAPGVIGESPAYIDPAGNLTAPGMHLDDPASGPTRPGFLITSSTATGKSRLGRIADNNRFDVMVNVSYDGTHFNLDDTSLYGVYWMCNPTAAVGGRSFTVYGYSPGPNPRTSAILLQLDFSGKIITYALAATAGIGLTPVYAAPDYSNNSSSLGPLALSVGGGMAPAGSYLVGVTLVTHTTGTGNVILTITFNDGNRVETITLPLTLNAATALTPVYQIYTSGGANITFATAYTGPTGTYDLHVRLIALG